MLPVFFNSLGSSASQQQPIGQAPSKKRFGKKLYITVAAMIIITVVLCAIFLVPSSNAENISLSVYYSHGEKLTYDVTSSSFNQIGNSSTNSSTQSTLTIEVVSINGDTYTLNYTTTSANSLATSHLMEAKEADMVNLFTLLPAVLQQYMENTDSSSPLETAVFNQSEAKVGDTWQIPVSCAASPTPDAEITVKFVAIQNLAVEAGNFKVFKIEFTQTSAKQSQNQPTDQAYGGISGESYLEFGSCKQIQSTLQLNMTVSLGTNGSYCSVVTCSSVLIKDENP